MSNTLVNKKEKEKYDWMNHKNILYKKLLDLDFSTVSI